MNILVAEDDKVLSRMLCGVLQEAGHICVPVYDAMQTFMYSMKQTPDLILLDVNMPGGSGVGALQKLKSSSKTAGIPVIVLSGSIDPALPKQVLEMGAVRFLAKPVEPETLTKSVVEALR
ncbi:MAG: response regulator [Gemmatimonadota bacterium]|nr:response regulator [Gemmatimonadota bacterium]